MRKGGGKADEHPLQVRSWFRQRGRQVRETVIFRAVRGCTKSLSVHPNRSGYESTLPDAVPTERLLSILYIESFRSRRTLQE